MDNRKLCRTLVIGIALSIGFVGGMSVSAARAAGRVQYKAVQLHGPTDLQHALDQYSNDGWEFVSGVMDEIVFKK